MHAAQGILTATGGMTSHAAVVARGMGKCCVAGAGTVRIDYEGGRFTAGDAVNREGDVISLEPMLKADGTTREKFLDDFWPAVQPNAIVDGELYAIPYQNSTPLLYFNVDHFKEAGLDVEPLKFATNRLRPDDSNHQSFPSGHAAVTFAVHPWCSRSGNGTNSTSAIPAQADAATKRGVRWRSSRSSSSVRPANPPMTPPDTPAIITSGMTSGNRFEVQGIAIHVWLHAHSAAKPTVPMPSPATAPRVIWRVRGTTSATSSTTTASAM